MSREDEQVEAQRRKRSIRLGVIFAAGVLLWYAVAMVVMWQQ